MPPVGADPTAPPGPGAIERPLDPVPGRYIVQLAGVLGSQVAPTAARLAAAHDGDVVDVYRHGFSGFAVQMSDEQARALRNEPGVESVAQDGVVHIAATESPAPWDLDRIDQRDLPLDNAYTPAGSGASVHAYIIDTGIRITHQDFGGRATVGDDEVGDGQNGLDCNGHGTHVAGIVGGAAYGVAKSVSLVSVRVLDCSGAGDYSQVIAGVDWVTAHAVKPAVANMSLGGSLYAPLDAAVESSIASGVTYAIAAGNSGSDACNGSPADVPTALTTAATDETDTRPSFSDFGTCVKLFAPGVDITSDWNTSDTATMSLSGTSMATAVVTGIAAVFLDRYPSASPAHVLATLVANATPGHVIDLGSGSPNELAYSSAVDSTHPGIVIAAAGVASTEGILDRVLGTDPADPGYDVDNFDVPADSTADVTIPGDADCGSVSYGDGATTAPDAADAARAALAGSVAGTYPDPSTGAGRGCIDIARSDAGPRAIGPSGDDASFEYYAFALDAVTWASPSLAAPAFMTLAQLRDVYACSVTDWSQLTGGGSGPIQRFMPSAGSGTGEVFVANVLGFDPRGITGPNCPPVATMGENNGTSLLTPANTAAYQRAIVPYSAGAFVFQGDNATNPTLDLRGGVRPGGILAGGSPVDAVRWTGSAWLLNNASIVGGRSTNDAVTTGTPTAPSAAVVSPSAGFTTADLGMTVSGTDIPAGAVVTAVDSSTQIEISIPTIAAATNGSLTIGIAAVSEMNPNLTDPGDTSVFPGMRYLYDVVDSTEPAYTITRGLVGFEDAPGGAKSQLCSGSFASTIRAAGFLDLAATTSPGGNPGVTCRRQVP
jgi:subtilisin family serine protease